MGFLEVPFKSEFQKSPAFGTPTSIPPTWNTKETLYKPIFSPIMRLLQKSVCERTFGMFLITTGKVVVWGTSKKLPVYLGWNLIFLRGTLGASEEKLCVNMSVLIGP